MQVFTGDTFVRQHIRMRAAREHLPTLAPLLAADAAFSKVVCSDFTGSGGSLSLRGDLADRVAFERLREIVASTHPPVTVWYSLQSEKEIFHAVVPHE